MNGTDDARYAGEHRFVRPSGAEVWMGVILSVVRHSARGDVRLVVVVANDITARKRADLERSRLVRELQAGIMMRDDFLSLAAHELRTPITPLRLQTTSLIRDLEKNGTGLDGERLRKRLESIDRSADRLGYLVHRLLEVSRLNAGSVVLDVEELDLSALVQDVVARMKREADGVGSRIDVRAPRPVHGRWDRYRLDQVLTNLLSNAIKYGSGRPIEVTVAEDGPRARLSIRDHGVGIPEEAQQRIFGRFERVGSHRHYAGLGLGLWIVRLVVEAHAGQVRVVSRPGEGAEFVVELPRAAEAVPATVGGGNGQLAS
jgi:signal transduction histidine kinase